MKGLEALEIIGNINLGNNPYCAFEHNKLKNCSVEEYNIIEKELKALEIVDKKRVNVHKFKWCVFKKYYVNYYNLHFCDEDDQFLNEQEFDLLKEVFCNDISNRS